MMTNFTLTVPILGLVAMVICAVAYVALALNGQVADGEVFKAGFLLALGAAVGVAPAKATGS